MQSPTAHDKFVTNMIKYPHHYCHVTTDMVQWILSHDNERELNDGRRTSHPTQRAWLEPVQRQETTEEFLLCSQVEARPDLPDLGNKVVGTDERKSSGEDRGYRRVVNIFSAATRSTPIDWNPLSAERSQSLPHAYNSTLPNATQHRATLCYARQRVAMGGNLYEH